MCGLVGMMGALEIKHRSVMKDLLYLDTLRGQDSTGVASVTRDRKVEIRKLTMPGYDFVNMNFIDNLMRYNDQLWIGHNRFKTRGSVTRLNAHPFEVVNDEGFIDLIGAHNGTLDNQHEIEGIVKNKFGTDSEALMNLINQVGPKEAIAESRGAWSLVWWDAPANKLCMLRNDKRPMFFAYTKDRKAMVWASEVWMILAACNRNGLELEANENGLSCYSTTPDTLYSFDIPQDNKDKIAPPTKEGGLLGKPEKAAFSGGFHGGWREDGFWDRIDAESKADKKNEQATQATTTTGGNNVTCFANQRGYNGNAITTKERDDIAASGCGWCGGKVDPKKMGFLGPKEAVCGECRDGGHVVVIAPAREILTAKKD